MSVPISIRPNKDMCDELEAEARRTRIRNASALVGGYVAISAEGQAFYSGWAASLADAD
jgi:hypothetical protein